jgi:hypothetical protein
MAKVYLYQFGPESVRAEGSDINLPADNFAGLPLALVLPELIYNYNVFQYNYEINFSLDVLPDFPLYRSRLFNPIQKALGNGGIMAGNFLRERFVIDTLQTSFRRQSAAYNLPNSVGNQFPKYGLGGAFELALTNTGRTTICNDPPFVVDPLGLDLAPNQIQMKASGAEITMYPLQRPADDFPDIVFNLADEDEPTGFSFQVAPGVVGTYAVNLWISAIGNAPALYAKTEYDPSSQPDQFVPVHPIALLHNTANDVISKTCECVKLPVLGAIAELGNPILVP